MSTRATQHETELRVAHAAELVAEGQAYFSITTHVALKHNIQDTEQEKSKPKPTFYLKMILKKGT